MALGAPRPGPAGIRPALTDSFGRTATDLRISVTDRCNFRCRYCMPPEGLPWMDRAEILTFEETARIARVLMESGVDSIKITGGEPLVRRDLPVLVAKLRAMSSEVDLSITTNGYLLADAARPLAEAGLDRATVSCDSLLRHRFAAMTLRDAFDRVIEGARAAAEAGLTPVKVNTVVIRGENDDEVVDFARLARDTGYDVRFIEYMPLDAQGAWDERRVVPGDEILSRIDAVFPLESRATSNEPTTSFGFADGARGSVGVIPSVTQPFCDTCNRLRLTADGHLRACLFSLDETDLKTPLRRGADDDEIAALARACIAAKWAGHRIGRPDFVKPARSMSMIGG